MEKHWVETLGNASSDKLRAIWGQLAEAFGQAIGAHGTDDERTWRVLQPPTGTGKTQGLCVYAAMLAEGNLRVADGNKVGMLVVTRLIDQCNEVVESINHHAGAKVAIAKHSEAMVSADEVAGSDILVVTHQAYVNAAIGLAGDRADKWSVLVEWNHGRRKLTVIDEALANMVEEYQITSSAISQALGHIPEEIRMRFPDPILCLREADEIFQKMSEMVAAKPEYAMTMTRMVWKGTMAMPPESSMDGLRAALWNHPYDQTVLQENSLATRHRFRDRVDETLQGLEGVMANWAYYASKGDRHTLNCARLAIPDSLPGPAVLDATATQNFLWELFSHKARVYAVPADARAYGNVTLHVARCDGIGKTKMEQLHQKRLQRLLADLAARLGQGRRVFLCCHKKVAPYAKTFEPEFAKYSVGHWGAIDGRNDWKDCDVVVLFGLSYRDQLTWANNAFMAFQGRQEDDWIQNPVFKQYDDVRIEMQRRQIAVSVIQALNRVQCRKVIDEVGNCAPTDAFILLPRGAAGDSILDSIQADMPAIKVAAWDFELDQECSREPTVRRGSSHEAILAHMESKERGEYPVTDIRNELEISYEKWRENVAPCLRNPEHPLAKGLVDLQVSYLPGRGRGGSKLVKQ
ncbi:hypothetical protein [Magnetospirillum gryphiswaldense]|nr:hypothetical protein [Magnetospirillum gryphiswaldense]